MKRISKVVTKKNKIFNKKRQLRQIHDLEDARCWFSSLDYKDTEELLGFLFALISCDIGHILQDISKLVTEQTILEESDQFCLDALMILLDLDLGEIPKSLVDQYLMIADACAASGANPLTYIKHGIPPFTPGQQLIYDLADKVPEPDSYGGYANSSPPIITSVNSRKTYEDDFCI